MLTVRGLFSTLHGTQLRQKILFFWPKPLPCTDRVLGHRLAREAVQRALALNPNLAEAHAQMGRIKEQADFDWAGADAAFRRAIVLEPENPEFARMAAFSAANLGRFDEAI
jgi:tetratricopeptide (TPR) repeat protein